MGNFDCWMTFMRSGCKYKGRSKKDLDRHVKEIHEPEALEANGFDPGYAEPRVTHINRIFPDGHVEKTTERINKVYEVGEMKI